VGRHHGTRQLVLQPRGPARAPRGAAREPLLAARDRASRRPRPRHGGITAALRQDRYWVEFHRPARRTVRWVADRAGGARRRRADRA
jgi:hypothetical protein